MASIESTLGKVVSAESSPIKRYVVEEPEMEQYEQQYQQPQHPQIQGEYIDPRAAFKQVEEFKKINNTLSEGKKSKLELLLGLRKSKKSIKIDGHTIVLQNLSSGDMKSAYKKIAENDKVVDQMFDTRHIFLCYSLYSFDGETISSLLGDDDDLETRLSLIENMSEDVVKELYEFYNKSFEGNHPKTDEEFKEVTSDIKK